MDAAPFDEGGQALELGETERAQHVGQPIVEAELGDLVVPRSARLTLSSGVALDAVVSKAPRPRSPLGVARKDRAALRGRDQLHGVEARRCSVANLGRPPPRATRAERMRRVHHDANTALCAERLEEPRVDRMAGAVDRDHQPRATAECSSSGFGRQQPGRGVDVGKAHVGTQHHCGTGGSHEGERRGDDLVAGFEPGRPVGAVQRGGARVDDGAVRAATFAAQRLLEALYCGTGRQPVSAQDLADGLDVRVVDPLPRVGQPLVSRVLTHRRQPP
jgi:hypothetical protein